MSDTTPTTEPSFAMKLGKVAALNTAASAGMMAGFYLGLVAVGKFIDWKSPSNDMQPGDIPVED